jgi:hypothetical protein
MGSLQLYNFLREIPSLGYSTLALKKTYTLYFA